MKLYQWLVILDIMPDEKTIEQKTYMYYLITLITSRICG